MRDRIVCVINDSAIQRRLLAEVPLSPQLAQGKETAAHNVKELQGSVLKFPAERVHQVAPQPRRHWSLMLAAYEYTKVFRSTEAHSYVDGSSRLPLSIVPAKVPAPPELVLLTEHLADSPVGADHTWPWTQRDPTSICFPACLPKLAQPSEPLSQLRKRSCLCMKAAYCGAHGWACHSKVGRWSCKSCMKVIQESQK